MITQNFSEARKRLRLTPSIPKYAVKLPATVLLYALAKDNVSVSYKVNLKKLILLVCNPKFTFRNSKVVDILGVWKHLSVKKVLSGGAL